MKVTTKTLDNCEVLMTVEIDKRQEDKILQKAARRIAREVKIPGFRPGKAPYRLIINRFGEEAIQKEAMDDLTQNVYQKAIKEADIKPFATASLEEIEWNPLVMKVKVPIEPVVELGNYRDMRLEAEAVEVSQDEVERQLEHLTEHYITFEPVERPAALGDMVSIALSEKDTASGTMLGEEREMDITLEYAPTGAPEPDLVTPLLRMSEDEEKTFSYTFRQTYKDKQYAGKEIEFHVQVHTVKVKEEVELDDEFAGMVGDFDTLDELKEKIEEDLIAQKQYDIDGKLIKDALSKLIEWAAVIEWPLALEEQELDNAIKNQESRLEQNGLDLNAMLTTEKKTLEEYRESLRNQIRENLKSSLALSKLVELEGLEVDKAEIGQQAEFTVAMAGGTQEAIELYTSPEGVRILANNLLTDKARQRLLAIVKGEAEAEVEAEAEEDAEEDAEIAIEEETVEEETPEAEVEAIESSEETPSTD